MKVAKPAQTQPVVNADETLPRHLVIIPDGNRRWAKNRRLPTLEGHRRGLLVAEEVANAVADRGIHTLTYWGFSTENWSRSQPEVRYLMGIITRAVDRLGERAAGRDTRVIHLGRKDRIPEALALKLDEVERATRSNRSHVLNLAFDYGGADEVERAVGRLLESADSLEEAKRLVGRGLGSWLDTADQPYPRVDLVIRTSGERRLSGFMPLQTAYAEYYFADCYWPDFDAVDLDRALADYAARARRFGK